VASTLFDSVLYRDVFSTPAMRAAFSDEAVLKAYVQAAIDHAKPASMDDAQPAGSVRQQNVA